MGASTPILKTVGAEAPTAPILAGTLFQSCFALLFTNVLLQYKQLCSRRHRHTMKSTCNTLVRALTLRIRPKLSTYLQSRN